MIRRHEVYIVCSLLLQLKKDLRKPLDRNFLSLPTMTQGIILTEHTSKCASGEKYRSRALLPGDTWLLPKMKRRPRNIQLRRHSADPELAFVPVYSTPPRTDLAVLELPISRFN
jgi:hypothetical protein